MGKFCQECGVPNEGAKFCGECGAVQDLGGGGGGGGGVEKVVINQGQAGAQKMSLTNAIRDCPAEMMTDSKSKNWKGKSEFSTDSQVKRGITVQQSLEEIDDAVRNGVNCKVKAGYAPEQQDFQFTAAGGGGKGGKIGDTFNQGGAAQQGGMGGGPGGGANYSGGKAVGDPGFRTAADFGNRLVSGGGGMATGGTAGAFFQQKMAKTKGQVSLTE